MNNTMLRRILAGCGMVLALMLLAHDVAEAAKFGGGRSFGGRSSYQRSAPAPTRTFNQQQATSQPRKDIGQPGVSPLGGRGGLLGGLLMGGLIGSMFFGAGHGIGGPGLLDMLLIFFGISLLMRFLRSRRERGAAYPRSDRSADAHAGEGVHQYSSQHAWGGGMSTAQAEEPTAPPCPPGFDVDGFLQGAKTIYTRLQTAWDARDLNDIRQFTSDAVFTEISRQAEEDPTPGKTEILLVTAHLVEAREVDDDIVATVLYDVMLRETGDGVARQDRELWHFSRPRSEADSFWKLEGIQQIEI